MTGPRPGRTIRAVIWVVTALLPSAAARRRYRAEFHAEIDGCTSRERAALGFGLLVHAWALRSAVAAAEQSLRPARPLGCRTNLHHQWHRESTDDGGRYRRCRRCGRDDPGTERPVQGAMVISNLNNLH